jgi:hypothetical protein
MNSLNKWALIALAGLLLGACGGLRSFRDMDANQDGRIDRAEAQQSSRVIDSFDAADDDDSGDLEPEEYETLVHVLEREHRNVPRRSSGKGDVDIGH